MSYNLTLQCGCIVYVACAPKTGLSHTRIVELRGQHCRIKHHDIGTRIYLWEMLPSPHHLPQPIYVSDGAQLAQI
jgi:hypothetical protein